MIVRRHRVFAYCLLLTACGDDGGGDSTTASSITSATATSGGSTTDDSTTTATGSSSTTADASSSSTTTGSSSSGGSSGGAAEDGVYPRPAAGTCPGDTAMISFPGGEICGPFCMGRDDTCPAAETGSAAAECVPFEQPGGSGTTCMDDDACPAMEACGVEGTCVSVAFWGCRLSCAMAQSCPDAMSCSGELCGY